MEAVRGMRFFRKFTRFFKPRQTRVFILKNARWESGQATQQNTIQAPQDVTRKDMRRLVKAWDEFIQTPQ